MLNFVLKLWGLCALTLNWLLGPKPRVECRPRASRPRILADSVRSHGAAGARSGALPGASWGSLEGVGSRVGLSWDPLQPPSAAGASEKLEV